MATKAKTLTPRIKQLSSRFDTSASSGKPWQKNAILTPRRLTGTTLQNRNKRIKLRDKYICQICKRVTQPGDLEIDHKNPMWLGATERDDEVWSVCKPCHKIKTAKEIADINGMKRRF